MNLGIRLFGSNKKTSQEKKPRELDFSDMPIDHDSCFEILANPKRFAASLAPPVSSDILDSVEARLQKRTTERGIELNIEIGFCNCPKGRECSCEKTLIKRDFRLTNLGLIEYNIYIVHGTYQPK